MLFDNYLIIMSCLVPVIVGLSEVIKKVGLPKKLIPLVNIAFGIVAGLSFIEASIQIRVLCGIVMGLSASGLFSGIKNVAEQFSK